VTLTTCAYAGEYSPATGLVSTNNYTVTGTGGAGNYLTIRTSADVLIQHGPSPQVVSGYTGDIRVVVNTNAACGTDATCHTLTVSTVVAPAACSSSSSFGSGAVAAPGGSVTLTTCAFAGDYSTATGLVGANTYTITGTGGAGNYLTIRTSANALIQAGPSPQVLTGYTGDIRVLVNTNSACGTDGSCHTLAVATAPLPPPDTLVPLTGNNSVACGTNGTLQDHAGSGNYSNNANGYTVLNAAATAVINVNGTYSTEIGWDFIRIYAGSGTGGTLLFGPVSGNGTINYTGAPGQTLTVQFTSDGSGIGTGFDLAVTYTGSCVNETLIPLTGNNSIACGTNTALKDHAGDGNYTNNANGYTVLTGGGAAVINVNGSYSTESSWDFIRIYAGSGTGGALLFGPVSGNGTINYVGAPGQTLTVQFTSDGSVTGTGFNLAVTYTGSCVVACTQPTATVTRDDSACPTFSLGVNITGLGDATDVNISYTVNGGAPVVSGPFGIGNQNIGPFGPGSSVVVTLVHNQDNNCNLALGTFVNATLCNDNCSNATTISCASSPVSGTTTGSTVDAVYSNCGAGGTNTTERGVWYKIVGDDNQYTITTCDAAPGYDTRLTVYSGSCGALNCVTANDDMTPSCTLGSFRSRVQFNANSGTDYYVFVHGYQSGTGLSATGNFVLNITCAPLCLPVPGNDACASATSLTVDAPALAGTNTCAAATVGNPSCESAFATLPDVFYSFTASPGGTNLITFNLYTAANLGYALYDACGGTQLTCNSNVTSGAANSHTLTGGNTYWVRVWTDDVTTGTFDIQVTQPCQPAGTRTVVADCGNNQYYLDVDVTSLGTSTDIDVTTDFVGDTEPTVNATGVVQIGPYPSGTTVVVTLVHDNGGACNLALSNVNFTCPPANDLCANAIAIGCNSTVSATTVGSTNTGNPGTCSTDLSGAGVWYTVQGWDGPMTASLCGSGYDTKLGVFTGSCGALTCVAGNDDSCGLQSAVSWTGTNGTTYYIYVTGFNGATGSFTLTTTCGSNNNACPENGLTLEIQADANFAQTSWEIVAQGTNVVASTGGGLPGPVLITQFACLPDGCYRLRVLDAGGDGISGGGYILRTQGDNQRVIDNRNNGNFGSVSAVIGNGGFCLPLGGDKLIFTSCDKMDWVSNQFIVAAENPAVSAEFGVSNTTSGYQFWWFDPNGTYGYAKFRSHATSDGFGTGATRACHARINNWSPNQIPANVMMNVKVRGRVNGTNLPWGPVCRFMIDPLRAACPFTKLVDIPANTNFSCGVTRTWGGSSLSKVVAKAVDGATQYQFRWNNAELAAPVIRTTTTPVLQLNWNPALDNGTYQVQVRAFKNGVWCVTSLPWGDECNVTITGSPNAMVIGGGSTTSTGDAKLAMFPNPNNGEQLTVSLSAVEEGVETISVDIFDLSGARVSSRTIAVNDGMVYQVLELTEMASGLYMVNITAGNDRYTERLVIAK
jgi:hypothetical protein